MPARGRARSQERVGQAGDDDNARNNERDFYKEPTLAKLTNNFDIWEIRVEDIFYAQRWDAMYTASNTPDQRVPDEELPRHARRRAWGVLKASLDDDITSKVKNVRLGDVEDLLRSVRKQFYKATVQSKTKLRKKLMKAQLEDHKDLGTYIAHIDALTERLNGLGSPVPLELKQFHLLEGLPADYDAIKQNIKIPREPALTWEQIVFLLEDYADDPKIPGYSQKTPQDAAHSTQNQSNNICRAYARNGKCRNGDSCKYKHVSRPNAPKQQRKKCNYCKRNGHVEKDCYKKQREEKEKKQECTQDDSNKRAYHARVPAEPIEEEKKIDLMSFSVLNDAVSDAVNAAVRPPNPEVSTSWLLDGGSNCIITTNPSLLKNKRQANIKIKVGGGYVTCKEVGTAHLDVPLSDGSSHTVEFTDVRLVPSFGLNVMPENIFLRKGCTIKKQGKHTVVQDDKHEAEVLQASLCPRTELFYFEAASAANSDGKVQQSFQATTQFSRETGNSGNSGKIHKTISPSFSAQDTSERLNVQKWPTGNFVPQNKIFFLSEDLQHWLTMDTEHPSTTLELEGACNLDSAHATRAARGYCKPSPELLLWHERLGHRNFKDVAKLINAKLPAGPIFCEACVQGKSTRHPLSKRSQPLHEAPRPGYMFHTDIVGPFSTTTGGGNRYLIIHVDDASRRIFASMQATTGAYYDYFRTFVKQLEAEFGREGVVSQVLADSASHYEKSVPLRDFCRRKGIVQLYSPPYTQSLNGVAERAIRTIVDMARTMLVHSGIPRFLYTRRSTMAHVFFFSGCIISWHSKLHSYVTTSTNHSEYCAAAKAAREAKWLEKIFTAIGFDNYVQPVDLFSDSQGAIAMNYNPVNRSASKHVDLADHYAREQVERGTITISYVPTEDMIADALTKALPRKQFERLRLKLLGA
jgi:hypothetical protein